MQIILQMTGALVAALFVVVLFVLSIRRQGKATKAAAILYGGALIVAIMVGAIGGSALWRLGAENAFRDENVFPIAYTTWNTGSIPQIILHDDGSAEFNAIPLGASERDADSGGTCLGDGWQAFMGTGSWRLSGEGEITISSGKYQARLLADDGFVGWGWQKAYLQPTCEDPTWSAYKRMD